MSESAEPRPMSLWRKTFIWVRRVLKLMLVAFLLYVGIVLIGLIPVNNNFETPADGIQIYLVSNAVHADLILPKITDTIDWSEKFNEASFLGDISSESHVAFGWGDRGFFLETETWNDFRLSTAANALFLPSGSCLHVSFTNPHNYREVVAVTISEQQYARLVEFIDNSFEVDTAGEFIPIVGEAHSTNDAFFCSQGRYHLLNTCNSWVGRALKTAGVRTPWLSPLPKTPMLYIDNEEIAE